MGVEIGTGLSVKGILPFAGYTNKGFTVYIFPNGFRRKRWSWRSLPGSSAARPADRRQTQ
jgi:hypothetical protein